MDPALEEAVRRSPADAEIEAVAMLRRGRPPPAALRIIARFGPVVTARLPAGAVRAVRADPAVRSLKASRPVEPAWGETGPDAAAAGPARGVPGATGRGVVLAFLDWGCDFAHPSLRRPDGRTRLRALWDQRPPPGGGPPARPYGYGRILGQAAIDAALRAPDPYAALGYHPSAGRPEGGAHGTHVMDIAAGNGRGAGCRVGTAPEAELIFVHLAAAAGLENLGASARILEALDLVRSLAGEDPWVANLSLGRTGGDHSGRSLVERAMDALLEEAPGRAIAQSCGNYFDKRLHAAGQARPGRSEVVAWEVLADDPTPNTLEVWYPGCDRLEVAVALPGRAEEIVVPLGERRPLAVGGELVGLAYHRACDPVNGDHHVELFLEPGAPAGAWRLRIAGVDVEDGRWNAWIERDTSAGQSRFAVASPTATVGTIATGRRPLVVGAYDPRTGAVAEFSSAGPTRDGRPKPDLVAPGVGIEAARSTPLGAPPGSGGTLRMSGTSMAAPHVAGAMALLFEAAAPRRLTIAETRLLVLGTADPLAGFGAADPLRVGSGALNVQAALAAVRLAPPERTGTMSSRSETETAPGPAWPLLESDGFERRLAQALGPAEDYQLLGRPGAALPEPLQPGDVLIRLGPGEAAPLVGRIAGPLRRAPDGGAEEGADGSDGGWYAPAALLGAGGWQEGDPTYARVVDHRGRVPPGQLVVRPRTPWAPAAGGAATAPPPAAAPWTPPPSYGPGYPAGYGPGYGPSYGPEPFPGFLGLQGLAAGLVGAPPYGLPGTYGGPAPYPVPGPYPAPPPAAWPEPEYPPVEYPPDDLQPPLGEQATPVYVPRSWALPTTEWAAIPYYAEWIKPDTLEYRSVTSRRIDALNLNRQAFSGSPFTSTELEILSRLEIVRRDPGSAAEFQLGLKVSACYPGTAASPTAAAPGGAFPVVLILPGNHNTYEAQDAAAPQPAPWRRMGTTNLWVREIASHAGYAYLQEDLARHGIASFGISTNGANAIDGLVQTRADLVLAYLDLLRRIQAGTIASPMAGRLDLGRVGVLGHSRGGDGVIKGTLDNARANAGATPPAVPVRITAVCALAPTDMMGMARAADRPQVTAPVERFLVLYGSHDGDISGLGGGLHPVGTGFRHYDRSLVDWDVMVFVRGIAHNRFNTTWTNFTSPVAPGGAAPYFSHGDPNHRLVRQVPRSDPTCGVAAPPGPPACPAPAEYRDVAAHQAVAREYMGGFFRWALAGEPLADRFKGAQLPLPATSGIGAGDVAIQYLVRDRRIVDGFQREPPGRNALGGPSSYASAQTAEFALANRPAAGGPVLLAPRVPHQTRILDARPGAAAQVVYRTEFPPGAPQDARGYTHVTFRMTADFDVSTAASIQADFPAWRVCLLSGTGTAPLRHVAGPAALDVAGVRAPKPPFFHQIWDPTAGAGGDVLNVTKLHFQTVAIPLTAFAGADLQHLRAIELELMPGTRPLYFDTLALQHLT